MSLAAALAPYAGRRFLGTITATGCIELVFDGDRDNLLTIFDDGSVAHGGVVGAAGYVARYEASR